MLLWSALLGCPKDDVAVDGRDEHSATLGEASGCDPLVPEVCMFPFPSGLFEVDDPSTPTGRRLSVGPTSLPANRDNVQIDPAVLSRFDGWSVMTPILTYFPDVALDGTIPVDDLDRYTSPTTLTVLVDVDTGERVPHWVELDGHARSPELRALMLRPAVPLEHGHRYVVGMRGLVTSAGAPVEPSEAFRALRDGTDSTDPDVASRVALFDDVVFPALADQGFAREELQLAWEFGTGSRETSVGPAVAVRDAALAQRDDVTYTISDTEEADCSVPGTTIARTVTGTLTTARFTDTDIPGGRLVFDGDEPAKQGTTTVQWMVRIPCSIAMDPQSGGRVLQYGHGLLGDLSEARAGYLSQMAHDDRYVVFAMNWTGMSLFDAPWIALMLTLDPSDFPAIPERSAQGFGELVVGLDLVTGELAADPALAFAGAPAIDTSLTPVYYGNSQGAILGGAYVALSPRIERAVLGVGGMPYSLLLARSNDFEDFLKIFQEKFPDDRDIALLIGVFQTVWDMGESGGYAHALRDPLPGTPDKRVLLQVAQGDAQVSTLGAAIQARAWDMVNLAPVNREVWGVESDPGPVSGNVLVEWKYTDGSEEPVGNTPPSADGDTHECPRREPEAQAQLHTFLETGVVEQTCVGGPCVGTRAGLCD